ncbi:MAG: 4Fe-4S dicluster domain-containing protein [Candidatus Marinimicrobia bacterium]|nr:4Fe-4S dicluster domain-containing protein [Candidatus Neomarinimicrobiota bacterium]MDP7026402.1 4Fe-4S dicluster domain-containing protein [Candidatus Neomarinimicrobiota bacterium]
MSKYFSNIWLSITTLLTGMRVTLGHVLRIRKGFVTLQYPVERWPRPERNIGFNEDNYNIIRSRLTVDIDDCIGCMKCERACPVGCIRINTEKVEKGEDITEAKHRGVTSHGTQKRLLVTRFDIDLTECCYCNLCTYPCPEECIFMTGGPNSNRHGMEYEFSEYDRNDLIFRFSKVPDDIVESYAQEKLKKEAEKAKKAEGAES